MKTAATVIFRWDDLGDVFAVFPNLPASADCNCTVYQHVGQHSGGDYRTCIRQSRRATPVEYQPLQTELASIGYELKIRKGPK